MTQSGLSVLGDDERQRLHALVEIRGELQTAELLQIRRETLTRSLSQLPVRRGTLALIRQGLGQLESPTPVAGVMDGVLDSLVERAITAGQDPAAIATAGGPVAAAVERVLARRQGPHAV